MPKPRNRILIVLLLSILVFALVDGLDLFSLQSPQPQWLGTQRLDRIQLWLAMLFWPLVPLGLYLIYFGMRILSTGQFPPPGSRLIKRAGSETGRMATIRGWLAILSGASLCVLAIYAAVIVPGELSALSAS
jgi:hypothetical protein